MLHTEHKAEKTKARRAYNGGGTIAAEELRDRVTAIGMSQKEFLEHIGKEVTHGNRYFTGKLDVPLYIVRILESLELKKNLKILVDE